MLARVTKVPALGMSKASIVRESTVIVCNRFDVVETGMCGLDHNVRVRHGGFTSPDEMAVTYSTVPPKR